MVADVFLPLNEGERANQSLHAPLGLMAAEGANVRGYVAMATPQNGQATIEDWLKIPEEKRAELVAGVLVYHAFPGIKHGDTQAQLSHFLRPYRNKREGNGGGGKPPGGWWLSQEVDLAIGRIACRPDLVGWRRDKRTRVPEPNAQGVITDVPDFICEVLSPSTARYDRGEKRDAYFRAGVPFYWLVDLEFRTLTVLERTDRGYLILMVAEPGEKVRPLPFDGIEIPIDELFMDEEGELSESPPPLAGVPEAQASASKPMKGAPKKKRPPQSTGAKQKALQPRKPPSGRGAK